MGHYITIQQVVIELPSSYLNRCPVAFGEYGHEQNEKEEEGPHKET